MTSAAEDNYLKAIYKIANYSGDKTVSTKSIAEEMQTSAPAVTDMLHKLAEKCTHWQSNWSISDLRH